MNTKKQWKFVRIALTTVYLFAGWILFSEDFTFTILSLGLLFSFAIALFTYSLFIHEYETEKRSLLPRIDILLLFLGYVVFKMYMDSFKVLYNVVRGNINPRIVHFRTKLQSEMARVILANSITLTPGTITLAIDDDHLIVHWLEAKTTHSRHSGELIKGTMEKLLKRTFV